MKNKKSLFMAIALLVLSIVIIAGSTYAYYIATINNDNASDVDIQARTLGLHFEDGAEINLPDALPGQIVIKKFSVENTGTESTTYNIYINDLINQFINTDELVYELTSTNGGATITERAFPTASGVIASNIEIPKDTTQEYTMTIRYINTNSSQNIDMGKKISGVIQITEKALLGNTVRMVVGENSINGVYTVFYGRGTYGDYFENVDYIKRNGTDVTQEFITNEGQITMQSGDEIVVHFSDKLTNMNRMFYDDADGTGYQIVDLSDLDTSQVTNMADMFGGHNLVFTGEQIVFGSNFDTSNVTNMSGMFYSSTIKNIDLSNFDTSKVTNMSEMFFYCDELTSLDFSNFDTSNVTNSIDMLSGVSRNIKIKYNSSIYNLNNLNEYSTCDIANTTCDNFFD